MTDVEKALEEIMEKESDAENTVESNKKKADHAKAVEMRKRAMESSRSTQKRKGVMKSRMKRMLKQSQRSQGGVVEKQLHIYARKMIWLRNGKLKSWNYKSSAWKLKVNSKTSPESNIKK